MATFGDRLKEAMELRGFSQNELTRQSGVGQGQISRLLKSDRPPANIWALARALHLRPEWLAFGEGPTELPEPGAGRVSVPHYDVRVSAGPGAIVQDEAKIGTFTCPVEVLRRFAPGSRSFALVTASGDSMTETIRDGELLLVDLAVNEPAGPGIYILVIEQETVVKRVQRIDRFLVIKSDNPAYESVRLGPKPASRITVVGRVCAVLRAL